MSLHDQIMNLPCETVMRGAERNIYRLGHLDARLAAAELADKALADANAELSRLRGLLENCVDALYLVRQFGGKGEIDGGPRSGMSVSFFVDNAYEAARKLAQAQETQE